eukprot:GHVQ01023716.1.p1 GENE.GHVQ01023716.1~~GHVQ01023716.1.p1  ORF type:complete len:572 (-),score=88.49 GHVQ01023716.1:1508-3223(-)
MLPSRAGVQSRLGTMASSGISWSNADVNVADRPVTQHGVVGMRTATRMGRGRQVHDKSYCMMLMRQKITDITSEMSKMQNETKELQENAELCQDLEKRHEELLVSVRNLEGELADYNLALDKLRSDTKPEQIALLCRQLKEQNDIQRKEVDDLFLEKKEREEQIQKIEHEISSIKEETESKLQELGEEGKKEYQELTEENEKLQEAIRERRLELAESEERAQQAESRIAEDANRMEYLNLQRQMDSVKQQIDDVEEEKNKRTEEQNLSVPEQRDLLLARVRTDNQTIQETEQAVPKLEESIQRTTLRLREIEEEMGKKGNGDDTGGNTAQKYDLLFSKDKEMTEFIDSFPELKRVEEENMNAKESSIVRALEKLNAILSKRENMPSLEKFKHMESDLGFKQAALEASELTNQRLQQELDRRRVDLEKVACLDSKVQGELSKLSEQSSFYTREIESKLSNIDKLKDDGNIEKIRLEERIKVLTEQVTVARSRESVLKAKMLSLEESLARNEVHQALHVKEGKLRQLEQTIYQIQQYIKETKEATDYDSVAASCRTRVEAINQKILKYTSIKG